MNPTSKLTYFKYSGEDVFSLKGHLNLSIGERCLIEGTHYVVRDKVVFLKEFNDCNACVIQYYLRKKHPEE